MLDQTLKWISQKAMRFFSRCSGCVGDVDEIFLERRMQGRQWIWTSFVEDGEGLDGGVRAAKERKSTLGLGIY